MIIVLGANGHVGSATTRELLKKEQPVTVVLHNGEKAAEWKQQGAQVAIADVNDTGTLRNIFRQGEKAFLLNPPAAPSADMVSIEKQSVRSILEALADSGLQKVVAQSTYGAQPSDSLGDLGVLYELEQGLADVGIPAAIIRGAYYMSNWDKALETAQKEGVVHTLFPIHFKLPMVAPEDLGKAAALLLMKPVKKTGLHFVEGPQQYSSADVADAFSTALNKPVKAVETPPDQWKQALQTMGFSDKAADSFVAMTSLTLKEKEEPNNPERGSITLQHYIKHLVSS